MNCNKVMFCQLQDRLCGTILRLNWIVALLTLVPFLFAILLVGAASMVVVYILIMICLVILSFGLLLLDEGFRNMFNADGLEQIEPMVRSVVEAYRTFMPTLIVLCAIFSIGAILLLILKKQSRKKVGGIVSAVLCAIVVTIAACVYYGFVLQV